MRKRIWFNNLFLVLFFFLSSHPASQPLSPTPLFLIVDCWYADWYNTLPLQPYSLSLFSFRLLSSRWFTFLISFLILFGFILIKNLLFFIYLLFGFYPVITSSAIIIVYSPLPNAYTNTYIWYMIWYPRLEVTCHGPSVVFCPLSGFIKVWMWAQKTEAPWLDDRQLGGRMNFS